MLLVAGLGGLGLILAGLGAGGGAGTGRIRESLVESRPDAKGRLALIEVSGLMMRGGGGLGEGPGFTRDLLAMLEHAATDPTLRGVLIQLDTPGGSVTDADLIHHKLMALRQAGKRVVVLMGDLCASGGLYAAVAAERIVALPTTVTGSIGVIISGLNVADLLSQHGVRDTSIMSGVNKAMLSPTRPVEPGHVEILRTIVDAMYDRFLKLVSEGRRLPVEKLRPVADGRVLTADQALAAGLVDEIGYPDDALNALRTLADNGPHDVVRYDIEPTFFELLKAQTSRPSPEAALLARAFSAPRAMYLLAPAGGLGGIE